MSTQGWKRPIITKWVGLWYVYKKNVLKQCVYPIPTGAHLYKMICPPDISTKSILSSIYSNQDLLQNAVPASDSPHVGVILDKEIFSTKWLFQRHLRESTFQQKPVGKSVHYRIRVLYRGRPLPFCRGNFFGDQWPRSHVKFFHPMPTFSRHLLRNFHHNFKSKSRPFFVGFL